MRHPLTGAVSSLPNFWRIFLLVIKAEKLIEFLLLLSRIWSQLTWVSCQEELAAGRCVLGQVLPLTALVQVKSCIGDRRQSWRLLLLRMGQFVVVRLKRHLSPPVQSFLQVT